MKRWNIGNPQFSTLQPRDHTRLSLLAAAAMLLLRKKKKVRHGAVCLSCGARKPRSQHECTVKCVYSLWRRLRYGSLKVN